jgi:hypothetical protein
MIVSELIAALKGVSPDAEVTLWCASNPNTGRADGDIIYIAITQLDDKDKLVVLSNCVVDRRGNAVFDAPPQIKRFAISSKDGVSAAIADLTEQAHCEATTDLRDELEKEKLRDIFRSFEDLFNQVQTTKNNR